MSISLTLVMIIVLLDVHVCQEEELQKLIVTILPDMYWPQVHTAQSIQCT